MVSDGLDPGDRILDGADRRVHRTGLADDHRSLILSALVTSPTRRTRQFAIALAGVSLVGFAIRAALRVRGRAARPRVRCDLVRVAITDAVARSGLHRSRRVLPFRAIGVDRQLPAVVAGLARRCQSGRPRYRACTSARRRGARIDHDRAHGPHRRTRGQPASRSGRRRIDRGLPDTHRRRRLPHGRIALRRVDHERGARCVPSDRVPVVVVVRASRCTARPGGHGAAATRCSSRPCSSEPRLGASWAPPLGVGWRSRRSRSPSPA